MKRVGILLEFNYEDLEVSVCIRRYYNRNDVFDPFDDTPSIICYRIKHRCKLCSARHDVRIGTTPN